MDENSATNLANGARLGDSLVGNNA